jgi:hypothetical protein
MFVVLIQLLLLGYHQFTTAVDLFPFNGVRFTKASERRVEQAVNGLLMGLPVVGFLFHIEGLIYYGVAYYFILLAVECATWWVPYLFGASGRWLEIYLRVHSRTIGVLPGRAGRTAPNLEHLILMMLTALTAFVTYRDFRTLHPGGYLHSWIPVTIGVVSFCGTALQQVRNEKLRPTA